jgi:ABC-type transport system involved in multi-copper enzyme maturation permease subunit
MLIEIQRYRRRYLSFSGVHAVNSAVLALALLCYAGVVLLVCNFRGALSGIALIAAQTGLFVLFAPGMLYGTIAGERERRSWDLLLVAPISKAQIVMGKLIGALTALGIAAVFFLVPVLIAGFSYGYVGGGSWEANRATNWMDLGTAEIVSLSFTILVCSLTILFSARVRRPFMAMANTLGLLILGLMIFPILMESAGIRSDDSLMYLHPFYVIEHLSRYETTTPRSDAFSGLPPGYWGWPQALLYLGISGVLIGWSINTLVFAENDVKFMPRRAVDA